MAKFGEADPRWKVKDMGDGGKNVNGWHWTENDTFPWFKEQFTSKFDDKMIFEGASNGPAGCRVSSNRKKSTHDLHVGHPEHEVLQVWRAT